MKYNKKIKRVSWGYTPPRLTAENHLQNHLSVTGFTSSTIPGETSLSMVGLEGCWFVGCYEILKGNC